MIRFMFGEARLSVVSMVNHSGKDWKQGDHVGRWQNRNLGMQFNLSKMHSYPKIHCGWERTNYLSNYIGWVDDRAWQTYR